MLKRSGIYSLLFVFLFVSFFSTGLGTATANDNFDVNVENAILVDADTGKILFEKNVDQPLPPASMVKMMSEYLILEAIHNGEISWDQNVPISEDIAAMSHFAGHSTVWLRSDGEYTVRDLYKAVAIESANAATVALAELIAGSEGNFVERMNQKGKELGLGELMLEVGEQYGVDNLLEIAEEELGDFQFVNSTGLPNSSYRGLHPEGTGENDDSYMSARAAATLAYHLVNDFPEVLDTASMPSFVFLEGSEFDSDEQEKTNRNTMLIGTTDEVEDYQYEYTDGLKTGYTEAAGYCFTGTAEKDGQRVITVVMKAESIPSRFTETKKLMEYGFTNFSRQELFPAGMSIDGHEEITVVKGKEKTVRVSTANSITAFIKMEDKESYGYSVEFDDTLFDEEGRLIAPIEANQVIGTMTVEYTGDGVENYLSGHNTSNRTVEIVTDHGVEKAGWFALMMRGIGDFFSGIWTSVADTVRGWF
ncbi:D-alanyl-D-alanine carboxypeptidase family protein [Evansella tamaricis]|uniref:D-alanyl-D-alanine carboxypeptidase n=1 Tax=Evansella tamaricis TaxID=2069301 RepID=A0ABS6JDN5_9BACI|nr:D-alanyl-D-alanine carboxypeptidase family protein [Evansella tamaricis]MBU9711797.1 D-alanyl-D-alanine carboxypeptidase [Evansella tamaricis]